MAASTREGLAPTDERPIQGIEFKLRPATRIFGNVIDVVTRKPEPQETISVGLSGRPLEDFPEIKLDKPTRATGKVAPSILVQTITTDDTGFFETFLGEGNYKLRLTEARHVKEISIQNESELELQLLTRSSPKAEFTGDFIDSTNNNPIANGSIIALPLSAEVPVGKSRLRPTVLLKLDAHRKIHLSTPLVPTMN